MIYISYLIKNRFNKRYKATLKTLLAYPNEYDDDGDGDDDQMSRLFYCSHSLLQCLCSYSKSFIIFI